MTKQDLNKVIKARNLGKNFFKRTSKMTVAIQLISDFEEDVSRLRSDIEKLNFDINECSDREKSFLQEVKDLKSENQNLKSENQNLLEEKSATLKKTREEKELLKKMRIENLITDFCKKYKPIEIFNITKEEEENANKLFALILKKPVVLSKSIEIINRIPSNLKSEYDNASKNLRELEILYQNMNKIEQQSVSGAAYRVEIEKSIQDISENLNRLSNQLSEINGHIIYTLEDRPRSLDALGVKTVIHINMCNIPLWERCGACDENLQNIRSLAKESRYYIEVLTTRIYFSDFGNKHWEEERSFIQMILNDKLDKWNEQVKPRIAQLQKPLYLYPVFNTIENYQEIVELKFFDNEDIVIILINSFLDKKITMDKMIDVLKSIDSKIFEEVLKEIDRVKSIE